MANEGTCKWKKRIEGQARLGYVMGRIFPHSLTGIALFGPYSDLSREAPYPDWDGICCLLFLPLGITFSKGKVSNLIETTPISMPAAAQ